MSHKGFAIIDPTEKYRYLLVRDSSDSPVDIATADQAVSEETLLAIMLNPSTADADTNDMTIRKLISYSSNHGFKRLEVVNLFGCRATDPSELLQAEDPIGAENDSWIKGRVSQAEKILLGWGVMVEPLWLDRAKQVCKILPENKVICYRKNQDGSPSHPSRHMCLKAEMLPYDFASYI